MPYGSLHRARKLTNLQSTAKANAVAKAINDAGGQAIAVPGDMLNVQDIDELVKKAAEFGGGKIHIIVNNAGFTWDGVIHKVWAQFQKLILQSKVNDG